MDNPFGITKYNITGKAAYSNESSTLDVTFSNLAKGDYTILIIDTDLIYDIYTDTLSDRKVLAKFEFKNYNNQFHGLITVPIEALIGSQIIIIKASSKVVMNPIAIGTFGYKLNSETVLVKVTDKIGSFASTIIRPFAKGFNISGIVKFCELSNTIFVIYDLSGLPRNSSLGFHLHTYGDMMQYNLANTGGHYNPGNNPHGCKTGSNHAGDFGNIVSDSHGYAYGVFPVPTEYLTVAESIGRAVTIHGQQDPCEDSMLLGPRAAGGVLSKSNNKIFLASDASLLCKRFQLECTDKELQPRLPVTMSNYIARAMFVMTFILMAVL
jgi:Cu-Zn family superoxide dismutase